MPNTDKLRIVVGINSLTESQWPSFNAGLQLFYRLGKDFPNADMILYNPLRVGIDRMRNDAAAFTIAQKADYLLFLDDDVVPPSNCLQKLIDANADIAAGDVIIRGYPFDHMCFRYTDDTRSSMKALAEYPEGESVINVDAVGFSLCLIRRSLLEQVPAPYFITGTNHTEDVYFCLKARDFYPDCTIKVDTTIECGHILWPEVISSANKKNYKAYLESQFPELLLSPQKTELKLVRVSSDTTYEKAFGLGASND